MSDVSLLTGVYADVEAYATLIDTVIERLRDEGSNPENDEQRRLAHLLIQAHDQGRSSQSLEALILDTLLRSDTGEQGMDLGQIGRRLLTDEIDSTIQKQLEVLANELEKQRAEVAARLRGR
jgi:hypothetical protein